MDLIYMNSDMEDIGVLLDYEFDLAFGKDENNFECQIVSSAHCCEGGYYLYIEGTEYGGIIDSIKNDTGAEHLTYAGRTWHGIIESKVIMPLTAADASMSGVTVKTADSSGASLVGKYLVISGDANACMSWIISRVGLSELFSAPSGSAGVNINAYQFERFTDAYSGLKKMLASAGLKLHLAYSEGKVVLSAVPRYDYSQDEEFNSDRIDFTLEKNFKPVNHLICLGSGELDQRTVIHLYADSAGNISRTQTFTGMDERTEIYDYSSAESEEDLIDKGTERFKELFEPAEISVDFNEGDDTYDVGDIVGAYDEITQLSVSAAITKKIITIQNGKITIQYKVGD